jgi:hypothetical protein
MEIIFIVFNELWYYREQIQKSYALSRQIERLLKKRSKAEKDNIKRQSLMSQIVFTFS